MSDPNNERDLKSAIRELATALESGLEDHPSSEKLQGFVAGNLPGAERARVQEHLALCQKCTRVVKGLRAREQGDLLTTSELEREWHRFQTAAGISRRKPRIITALAAVLLLTVLGLTAWGIRESLQPRADVYSAHLFPGQLRSSEKPLRLPPWANSVLLELTLETLEHPEYRVKILTEAGRPIWSGTVPRQEDGVAVEVPIRLLPAGAYRIRVFGPKGEPVSEYTVEIEPAPDN